MGNGSSQSIVLGPPRYHQEAFTPRNGYHQDHRSIPKYVHPQNRVLPKPVAGQRLRSTDNGSILQTAGTIRGQRRDDNGKEAHVDPEVLGILRRRSEMVETKANDFGLRRSDGGKREQVGSEGMGMPRRRSEMIETKENDCYHQFNLRNHRLFHSDPNIARRPGGGCEDVSEGYSNRRSCTGGAAVRASKLKYKKKSRAPEPPPLGNSLPRQLEMRPQNNPDDIRNRKNNLACKCIAKTRAPQPPAIVVHPPPPPPLPNAVTTRTKIGSPQSSKSHSELSSRSPTVTRAVECRTSYEKKVHPLEKWRNCRSTGDIRIDEEEEDLLTSRTTIFDSRKISDSQGRLPSYLPQKPDPFQKEIQAVTKKIAESRQQIISPVPQKNSGSRQQTNTIVPQKDDKATPKQTSPAKETNSPPKFYFADPGVFRTGNSNQKIDPKEKSSSSEGVLQADNSRNESKGQPKQRTTVDEIVPCLQRFSPGRQRFKTPSRSSTPTPQQKAEKEWEHLTKSLYHNKDADSDIDIRLRPVLPRKPPEVPKFSPSEAWQALGSDGLGSSNQSTSDDGRESLSPYKRGLLQREAVIDRPRRFSDMDYDMYENRKTDAFKHRSMSDSHWTPRQDLMDDSDEVCSEGSEDAVVPRIHPGLGEISTRFSLPTVMFSNMRPIGSEIKSNTVQPSHMNGGMKTKQSKKKVAKRNEPFYDNSPAPNFRMFLSKRNKFQSEEDIAVSDSNWTFGQYGLAKRGKQYSSDLMLSDKKKHEIMAKNNFSDFLGDILVSKANHMRKQMKSSDSGNSNFSFYSTEGQVMYMPDKKRFVAEEESSPPIKGRVYDMRRRFDANFSAKNAKKKTDVDLGRRRDLELAKMLEDEVRKRRNKEKITIRQQLQRIKNLQTDEEDEFDDEAYFTEPKSREESQSPFFSPSHNLSSEIGLKQSRFGQGSSVTAVDSSCLSHWQSSPALLEDSLMKNGMQPNTKGRLSLSSVMSSPESDTWVQSSAVVDTWLRKQQLDKKSSVQDLPAMGDPSRLTPSAGDDGDVSSSPTPAPPKKERRKTNIYKQLMDIVRKEERHLKNAQKGDSNSRDSSYSHRESSPSTCSESSSTSSYSYSDSSSARNNARNGVPANKEFGYKQHSNGASSFQVAFVQPYSPSKSYRPVPFDVVTSAAATGYRLPGLQEEGKHVQAEVS